MLSRHIARAAAPVVARTATATASRTSSLAALHKLSRGISTSPPLLAAFRRSASLLALSPSGTGGTNGPDQHEIDADKLMEFDPRLAAVSVLVTAIMAACLYWGVNDSRKEKESQDAAMEEEYCTKQSEDLAMYEEIKEEMKSKFGLTEAQCEEAEAIASTQQMRAAVVAASSGPKFSPEKANAIFATNPILGEDYIIAPWWKRTLAFIIDNLSTNALMFVIQMLAVKVRPDLEEIMLASPMALGCSFLANVLVETVSLLCFNGRTLGKSALGLRVIRQDQEKINLPIALTQSTVRAVCTPILFIPEFPTYFTGASSRDSQLLHNWASGTIVIDERAAAK